MHTQALLSSGSASTFVPDQEEQGLDRSSRPTLDEVLGVGDRQPSELAAWLGEVTAEQLALTAPVPPGDGWPVRQAAAGAAMPWHRPQRGMGHYDFCVRNLGKLSGQESHAERDPIA